MNQQLTAIIISTRIHSMYGKNIQYCSYQYILYLLEKILRNKRRLNATRQFNSNPKYQLGPFSPLLPLL